MADPGDVADFQQWLHEVPPSHTEGASTGLGTMLRTTFSSLHETEHGFDKALHRTSRTGDPVEALAVQRNLSELYLSHGLAVKVIGKTTQAIETLMRLN
jgi:hypothetical protein